MDHNVGSGSMNELRVNQKGLCVWRYSLNFVQDGFDIRRLLQVRLEDGWRSCTPISLSDHENARVLEGVEDLATKEAASSSNKNYGRHIRAIGKEKMPGKNLYPFVVAGPYHDVTDSMSGFAWPRFVYRCLSASTW